MTNGRYTDARVCELDYNNMPECPYPGIWITVPVYGSQEEYLGRDRIAFYPITSPYMDPTFLFSYLSGEKTEDIEEVGDRDKDGSTALYFGGQYYDEGMSCDAASDAQRRSDCFRAAEILYWHAVYRGNMTAYLCLGYIYAYDRCDGHYLRKWWSLSKKDDDLLNPFPLDEEAYRCFKLAANADIAEGCYKFGDMLKTGRGCAVDLERAFSEYRRAFELGRNDSPYVWGSAALRLAECYEEGAGCEQNFAQALKWYESADTGLGAAVRDGNEWYRKHLAQAKSGVVRMKQEISGCY